MSELNITPDAKIIKVDKGEGIVYGFAIVCKVDDDDYYDIQGDHIPEDVMRSAATDFMKSERGAKAMHMGVCKGRIVHSLPLTTELGIALGLDGIDKSGWIIGMQPDDDEILQKFANGEFTGFSIGGLGTRVEAM